MIVTELTMKLKKSTTMDNNLKSVPQRKLLRNDQKALLQFILNRSEECGSAREERETPQ